MAVHDVLTYKQCMHVIDLSLYQTSHFWLVNYRKL